MNIVVLGAASFIGTNLSIKLISEGNNHLRLVDKSVSYFISELYSDCTEIIADSLSVDTNFDEILRDQDVVYHLVSSNNPTNSNEHISLDLVSNVVFTSYLLEACVRCKVKKIVFISSGGTVYGKNITCPIKETQETNPITSYGIQKLSIEKLLFLYNHLYNLDYRIVRLANPYGPYQRPNGILGAVTTFTYKALKHDKISVYGDGRVVRDFIYIDDAITAILKIAESDGRYKLYNVGCGHGTSISELLDVIQNTLNLELQIEYMPGRNVDVPVNYLDVSRYEEDFGEIQSISLEQGIRLTADFMKTQKYL